MGVYSAKGQMPKSSRRDELKDKNEKNSFAEIERDLQVVNSIVLECLLARSGCKDLADEVLS
jgi:hypothetical protein